MDIFIPIFIFFTIFVMCSLCGFCCRKQSEGAIYSTPVVITSQTHQPVGSPHPYPVSYGPGVVQTSYQTHVTMPPQMPMPYNDSAPYPSGPTPYPMPGNPALHQMGQQPMYPPQTGSAPYPPQTAPYPSQTAPYPSQSAPYPSQAMIHQQPPAYNEVVGNENFQKQSAYNPNFTN